MNSFGLIGYPIEQSLSPWIHEQFLTKANVTGRYSLYELNPETTPFHQEIANIKSKFDGFNITLPYKETIIPHLDVLASSAKSIGAVNTVAYENGVWKGYNTDGIGYVRSLANDFPQLFTNFFPKTLIIGSGGAARGIYHALLTEGVTKIDLMNRTKENAQKIARLRENTKVESTVFSLRDASKRINSYDLIIQTTSVGMKPKEEEVIFPIESLKDGVIVSDIVYQPINTVFLQQAKAKGARIHFGHTMLLYQAQYAFEIWTNQKVAIDHMENQLQDILEGR